MMDLSEKTENKMLPTLRIEKAEVTFPTVRYRGNKQKLISWISKCLSEIEFSSFLDLMGGTGCVAYEFKKLGKQVLYNDVLKFNHIIGQSLIENCKKTISEKEINQLLKKNSDNRGFIPATFKGLYFKDHENEWIENTVTNILELKDKYKMAIAFNALFQSCIIKRPFGIWHRANLYFRENKNNKPQSFGNGSSWERPFEIYFKRFIHEINNAIFSNGKFNMSYNENAFDTKLTADLVYIDSPYMKPNRRKSCRITNYQYYYHFLEGLANYELWEKKIDKSKKTKPYTSEAEQRFLCPEEWKRDFGDLFNSFCNTTVAVSYLNGGIPSISDLKKLMKEYFYDVKGYKISHTHYLKKGYVEEWLLVGKPL